jgi:hypothetical protein
MHVHIIFIFPFGSSEVVIAMLRIQWMSSGEDMASIDTAVLPGATVKELKQKLQRHVGQPRFRQRLLSVAGDILDDDMEVTQLPPEPVILLVLLSFSTPSSKEKYEWFHAASSCEIGRLETFLLQPYDPNVFSQNGQTALHLLAAAGSVACCQLLLEAKGEINKLTLPSFGVGVAPLHMACVSGHHEVVRLLIQEAADANKTTTDGDTPMHIAAFNGQLEVVRLLLDAGADKDTWFLNCFLGPF